MFMTSAPRRLPASSKELCVRVEASKNRLISVRPRRASRFLLIWRLTSAAVSARSRSAPISPAVRSSQVRRWRRVKEARGKVMVIKAGPIRSLPGRRQAAPLKRVCTNFYKTSCRWAVLPSPDAESHNRRQRRPSQDVRQGEPDEQPVRHPRGSQPEPAVRGHQPVQHRPRPDGGRQPRGRRLGRSAARRPSARPAAAPPPSSAAGSPTRTRRASGPSTARATGSTWWSSIPPTTSAWR